jgi:hypothetical protein
MNTLAEILTNSYTNQGVQDLKVFFDSFFFNLKVKDNSKNYNLILIEKTSFDYNTESIEKIKNGLTVNFGDTGSDNPYETNGNFYIDSFLDSRYKNVLLVGTRKMNNGNTIPLIYNYNINSHSVKPVYPKLEDITEFNSFSNYTFKTNSIPVAKFSKNKLYIAFQTENSDSAFINKMVFTVYKDKVKLSSYDVYKYDKTKNIDLNEILDGTIHYSFGNYKGIFKKLLDDEFNYDPYIFTFLDFSEIFALDDGTTTLGADYSVKIEKNSLGLIGT